MGVVGIQNEKCLMDIKYVLSTQNLKLESWIFNKNKD